ncbi:response regulator [Luteimonas granuli]|uniref:Response regulator transcription factor n=1 Tax=Luteimonas granuli TaxID=1176533 RepID=A0A518N3E7_9GAMM|nr:response regulator transcription factor [Luteimonas granuli]QDW66432.1 response regulator transcription factor [Luteimonas granuli]
MIRILIADDHAIFRQGLARLIGGTPGMGLVGEAANGHEVLDGVRALSPDVLLLDLSMPGPGGVDLIKRLRKEAPGVPVLVLTVHDETELARRTIRAGAAGYLTKDGEPEDMLDAVRAVARGGNYVAQQMAARLLYDQLRPDAGAPHRVLSNREYQVFTELARGVPIATIGERLHISPKTVSTHKVRILQKLGLSGDAELIRYALRHRLVE